MTAWSPPSGRTRKQFSCTAPTVNISTSIGTAYFTLAFGFGLALVVPAFAALPPRLHAAAVDELVGVEAQRDVEEKHHRRQRDRLRDLGLEGEDEQHAEDDRGEGGARGRRLPGRLAHHAVAAASGRRAPCRSACARRRSAGDPCARATRSLRRRCRGACCGASSSSGPWCAYELRASSRVRRLATGTSSGKPSNAACGREADELAAGRSAHGARPPRRAARGVVRRWSSTFVETCATGVPPAVSAMPDRAHAGQALGAALADERGDRARVVERRRRRELDVEGDERRAGADERRAAARVGLPRAEVRPQLAGGDALGERRQAAAAQLRARAPAGELAVEEDRQAGAPELLARDERGGAGGAAAGGVEVDERRDVERADVRVAAALGAQVDERRRRRARPRRARRRAVACRRRACRRCGGGRRRSARRAAARRWRRTRRRSAR